MVVSDGHVKGGLCSHTKGVIRQRLQGLQVGICALLKQLCCQACEAKTTSSVKRAFPLKLKTIHNIQMTKYVGNKWIFVSICFSLDFVFFPCKTQKYKTFVYNDCLFDIRMWPSLESLHWLFNSAIVVMCDNCLFTRLKLWTKCWSTFYFFSVFCNTLSNCHFQNLKKIVW